MYLYLYLRYISKVSVATLPVCNADTGEVRGNVNREPTRPGPGQLTFRLEASVVVQLRDGRAADAHDDR